MERSTKTARPAVPNAKPRIKRVEQAMQIAVFENVRALLASGVGGFYAFAVPNGGKRSEAEARQFKRAGVMPGVADIVFMFGPDQKQVDFLNGLDGDMQYPGPRVCLVEMKKPKAGRTSNDQDTFFARAEAMGFDCRIWTPADAFEAKALVYGLLREYGVKV